MCFTLHDASSTHHELAAFFIKIAAPITATPLTDILNLFLQMAEILTNWKESSALPLFKGGDQTDPNNYRPISILPGLSKVFEKLDDKRLTGHLDMYCILSGSQSGLRPEHSCNTAPLNLSLNHTAIQFATNASDNTHHYTLYCLVLHTNQNIHWYTS